MRAKTGDGWRRARKTVVVLVVLAVAAGVVLVRQLRRPGPRAVATRVARYCELATQFDDIAVRAGAASAPGQFVPSSRADRRLLRNAGSMLDELQASAPGDVAADVKTMIASIRSSAAGDEKKVGSPELSAAVRKTAEFRLRSCSQGATSGEG